MKPIRLLVDSFADADEFNPQMVNAREIVSRLDPEQFHVTMFHCGEPDRRLLERAGTRIIKLRKHGQTLRILREFLWGPHSILFYVKASPASMLYLGLRSRWSDRRVVIGTVESQSDFRQDETIKTEQIRLLERTILRSDLLFSNSAWVRNSLTKHYALPSEVIPTGVDTKFFTPSLDRPVNSRARVLFVGSLRRFKRPQLLAQAASRYPNADFVIVGTGPLRAELETEVREKRLSNCKVAGGLYGPDLREEYRKADIFFFPSHWEGSPKVILEAASCGLPVIARVDYKPETVLDGHTGYLGASDEDMLERLGALLANPELCRRMGRASRALSEHFDWDGISKQWEEVFQREALRQDARS